MANPSHIKAIENEFKHIEETKSWHQLYMRVRDEGTYNFCCKDASAVANKSLNRYRDVLPYDHSRIVLHDNLSTDYINASLVKGPLSQTSPHFWLMVWQQNSKGIIMLNRTVEKDQIKCDQYFPLGSKCGADDTFEFPSVGLKVELTCLKTSETRKVLHFHYTTWPDFDVPQSPEAFYNFLSIVRASGCLEMCVGPAVVHCSAGIGRSGTFCLVDSVLLMLARGLDNSEGSIVLDVLLEMRKDRMGLIQTPSQLRFSYLAIVYGVQRLNETNGKDPEESSSEEPSISDEHPPTPPPRADSLRISAVSNEGELSDNVADLEEDSSNSPILDSHGTEVKEYSELPNSGLLHNTSDGCDEKNANSLSSSSLRHRQRYEKDRALSEKVQGMKEKMKTSEEWKETKRNSSDGEAPTKRLRMHSEQQ